MKLDKAIEILELNLKEVGKKMPVDTSAALALSIEAQKRVIEARTPESINPHLPLPGETMEETPA